MGLMFMDSFGYAAAGSHSAGVDDDLNLLWQSYSGVTVTEIEDIAQGRRCYITGGPQDMFGRLVNSRDFLPFTTITIGVRLWLNSNTDSGGIIAFEDERLGTTGLIGLNGSTSKIVYSINSSGSPTSDIVLSTTVTVPQQTWFYLEATVVFSNSVGEVHFWIDDSAAGSITGADTMFGVNEASKTLPLWLPNVTSVSGDANALDRFADIYMRDDATRMGPVEIFYQPCDTAGLDSDFTPSAGSNHQNVDEKGQDGDTTYNSSSTALDRDSFAHSDLAGTDPVGAIQALAMVRSGTDEHPATGKIGIRSGATDNLKDFGVLWDNYIGVAGPILENDPNTAAAWTEAGVDAAYTVIEKL